MAKTEVYSWRLRPEMKEALEERARVEGTTMARLLDHIVGGWLDRHRDDAEEAERRRLHAAATKAIGAIHSGDPTGSSRVREIVGAAIEEKIERRRARRSPAGRNAEGGGASADPTKE